MRLTNRRRWLSHLAGLAAGAGSSAWVHPAGRALQTPAPASLALGDFEPRSMLKVPVTQVERARYPLIDFHTHLSSMDRAASPPKLKLKATMQQVLPIMDDSNIRAMVNLTGGYGPALEETLRYWTGSHGDRFYVFTEPWLERLNQPRYPEFQAQQIEQARRKGARGLKVTKALGLYLREQVTSGPLVKIDDRRFDPMWEAAGASDMPVAIHTSDPEAFFLEINRFNERYEELNAHPNWSFFDRDFPSNRELHEARNRVIERHPRTQFVVLHVGDAEDLGWVSEWLDSYSNLWVEFGARIGELGRQPRAARRFLDRYQDRILFGTDATPGGVETPQQIFGRKLYQIYFRFLETEDEYFDYSPARIPPQGRWRIYGLGLPDSILRKVYYENAARLLQLSG
ncbi:MAG: amidohydrolase family protein [Acidobacteriota bacterium]